MSETKPGLVNIKNEPLKDTKVENKDSKVTIVPTTTGTVDSAALARIVADAVAEALKVSIPAAAVGINQANMQAQNTAREAQIRELMRKTKRCAVCGQPETACGGPFKKDALGLDVVEKNEDGSVKYNHELNHEKAYVGPKDANLMKWNPGIRVNGILYKSDNYGQTLWIPKKSDILTQIAAWEQNEKELMQKRTAHGQGMTMMPGGGSGGVQPAIGWR